MKAYEATLTIDGNWKATTTGSTMLGTAEQVIELAHKDMPELITMAKEIQITVKEI